MSGRAVVCVCLLFFSAVSIQAGTLSGDSVSMGQTNVRAQVVAPQETQDTGPQQITGTGRPETSGGMGESVQPVRSGDHSGWPFLLLASASSGSWIIVSVIGLKRRRRM